MHHQFHLFLKLLASCLLLINQSYAGELALGDVHLHYNRSHADSLNVEAIATLLKENKVGVDTLSVQRWKEYAMHASQTRHWLKQLPDAVAGKIALGNAQKLFDLECQSCKIRSTDQF